MSRRPIFLIVNPASGGKPGSGPDLHEDPEELRPEALAEALRAGGLEVELHELTDDDDITTLARTAVERGRDVVAAGGDGTVRGAAVALVGGPGTLGILPLGSFNNIARGFGIPVDFESALDTVTRGEQGEFDVGAALRPATEEAVYFFEAAGVGLEAVGFMAVELGERHGWWRALRTVWRGLRRRRAPVRLNVDGARYRAGTPAVTVCNGPYHGLGFAIAPQADPRDGLLDVAVFAGMDRWQVIRHFIAVARRTPRREARVRMLRGRRIEIEGVRSAHPVHVDGLTSGFTPVTFEVRPSAIRIFC